MKPYSVYIDNYMAIVGLYAHPAKHSVCADLASVCCLNLLQYCGSHMSIL